jgi:hypothetical protein
MWLRFAIDIEGMYSWPGFSPTPKRFERGIFECYKIAAGRSVAWT